MTTTTTTARTVTVRWFSDPGHGWLSVPRAAVRELGVKPSRYSYVGRTGGVLYLEEDCDGPAFLRAAEAAGWKVEYLPETVEHADSAIRALPRCA